MSGDAPHWNQAVNLQTASIGQMFRYNQPAISSRQQGTDEIYFKFCLQSLLENPQLQLYSGIAILYLQLDDASFNSLFQIRTQSPFHQDLNSHHASLYGSPPQELWNNLVQLRYHSTWPRSQRVILEALNSLVVTEFQQARPQMQVGSNTLRAPQGRQPTQISLTSPSGSSESSSQGLVRPENLLDSAGPTKRSSPTQDVFKSNISKTAPPGHCWRCPSANCKKQFVRMGHLKNHLSQLHPDFLSCHEDYDPDDYLVALPPSRTSSDETQLEDAHRNAMRSKAQGSKAGPERPRARTRTPSFNPSIVNNPLSNGLDPRSKTRPSMIRHHSDSSGWTNGATFDEFEALSNADFTMNTEPSFSDSDVFQQPYYSFVDSEAQPVEAAPRQFAHRPPSQRGSRGGSSTSPKH